MCAARPFSRLAHALSWQLASAAGLWLLAAGVQPGAALASSAYHKWESAWKNVITADGRRIASGQNAIEGILRDMKRGTCRPGCDQLQQLLQAMEDLYRYEYLLRGSQSAIAAMERLILEKEGKELKGHISWNRKVVAFSRAMLDISNLALGDVSVLLKYATGENSALGELLGFLGNSAVSGVLEIYGDTVIISVGDDAENEESCSTKRSMKKQFLAGLLKGAAKELFGKIISQLEPQDTFAKATVNASKRILDGAIDAALDKMLKTGNKLNVAAVLGSAVQGAFAPLAENAQQQLSRSISEWEKQVSDMEKSALQAEVKLQVLLAFLRDRIHGSPSRRNRNASPKGIEQSLQELLKRANCKAQLKDFKRRRLKWYALRRKLSNSLREGKSIRFPQADEARGLLPASLTGKVEKNWDNLSKFASFSTKKYQVHLDRYDKRLKKAIADIKKECARTQGNKCPVDVIERSPEHACKKNEARETRKKRTRYRTVLRRAATPRDRAGKKTSKPLKPPRRSPDVLVPLPPGVAIPSGTGMPEADRPSDDPVSREHPPFMQPMPPQVAQGPKAADKPGRQAAPGSGQTGRAGTPKHPGTAKSGQPASGKPGKPEKSRPPKTEPKPGQPQQPEESGKPQRPEVGKPEKPEAPRHPGAPEEPLKEMRKKPPSEPAAPPQAPGLPRESDKTPPQQARTPLPPRPPLSPDAAETPADADDGKGETMPEPDYGFAKVREDVLRFVEADTGQPVDEALIRLPMDPPPLPAQPDRQRKLAEEGEWQAYDKKELALGTVKDGKFGNLQGGAELFRSWQDKVLRQMLADVPEQVLANLVVDRVEVESLPAAPGRIVEIAPALGGKIDDKALQELVRDLRRWLRQERKRARNHVKAPQEGVAIIVDSPAPPVVDAPLKLPTPQGEHAFLRVHAPVHVKPRQLQQRLQQLIRKKHRKLKLVQVQDDLCFEKEAARPPIPNDPLLRAGGRISQWGLRRIGFTTADDSAWHAGVEAGAAREVVLAIIDTGLDWQHPDLDRRLLWRNRGEIPGNGVDDDGNGLVDDIIGWNFVANDNRPWDDDGHGTFVAGIIAAHSGNGVGIAGINGLKGHVRIMPLKALDAFGTGDGWNIARAIVYAVDNGASVINLSVASHSTSFRLLSSALQYAQRKGVVVVAAAGNDARRTTGVLPAALAGVITVAATDEKDRRARFSNWGAHVDIAAPGVNIVSLRARYTDLLANIPGVRYRAGQAIVGPRGAYLLASGTSFAAPFVSGTIAYLLSVRPQLNAMQAARMVLHNARDIETPGHDNFTGFGLLNATAALGGNPAYYAVARISGVRVVKTRKGLALAVVGSAAADRLKQARLYLAPGRAAMQEGQSAKWRALRQRLRRNVREGVLFHVPVGLLRGSRTWTLRLVVEHHNGSKRESRFLLRLQ